MKYVVGSIFFVLAVLIRWPAIGTTPWHPDEGMVAEAAQTLAQGRPFAVGAIRQTALFPLSCSPLPLLAAAAAQKLSSAPALISLRRWSVLLAAVTVVCLLAALWPMDRLGALAAAAILTFWPLARDLQVMGYYHHLSALFSVLSLWACLRYLERPEQGRGTRFALACGLAVASAYWTLWLLLLPALAAWVQTRDRKESARMLVIALLPLLAVLGWSLVRDSNDFFGDARELLSQTHGELPGHLNWIRGWVGYWVAAKSNPALFFAPLLWGFWVRAEGPGRWRSRAAWLGFWALACSLEVFRQRQNINAFAYPLILALPAAAALIGMGSVQVIRYTWAKGVLMRAGALLVALASIASLRIESDFSLVKLSSAPVAASQELFRELGQILRPGDLVLGQDSIDWALAGRGYRAVDLDQASAFSGFRGAFLRADMPSTRFVFEPTLEAAKVMIISPFSYGVDLNQPGTRRLLLRAEMAGWSRLWSNGTYDVYGNPVYGFPRPKTAERILRYYNLYDAAAEEAFDRSELQMAYFAALQARPYAEGDRQARQALFDKIVAAMSMR